MWAHLVKKVKQSGSGALTALQRDFKELQMEWTNCARHCKLPLLSDHLTTSDWLLIFGCVGVDQAMVA
eukprot:1730909-Amphidinium_carterae.1